MTDNQITEAAENTLSWTSGYDVQLRKCFLVVTDGPDKGKRIGPLGEQATIGRQP